MADARPFSESLIGRSLRTVTGSENRVLAVEGESVRVWTSRSPSGQPVPIAWVQEALERIERNGEIEISVQSVGYRSAFIGAVLQEPRDAREPRAVPKRRWTSGEKQSYARNARPVRLPIPLQVPHSYWPRIGALYDRFLEPRHALVHRRATVQPDGALVATNASGAVLLDLSSDEQDAFAHLARELAAAVIAGHADRRRHNRIAWRFDVLRGQHGRRPLGARKPRDVIREVIVNLDPARDKRWTLDGKRVHTHLRGQRESPFNSDLLAYAVTGSLLAEYRAICADVPDDAVEFDDDAPPAWLRRM